MSVSHMNPIWTRIHVRTSFYMVHTVNLQVHSRNLVGIGMHGSIYGKYVTRRTQTLTQPREAPYAMLGMGHV